MLRKVLSCGSVPTCLLAIKIVLQFRDVWVCQLHFVGPKRFGCTLVLLMQLRKCGLVVQLLYCFDSLQGNLSYVIEIIFLSLWGIGHLPVTRTDELLTQYPKNVSWETGITSKSYAFTRLKTHWFPVWMGWIMLIVCC